jgi:polynucleotide 5'-kinase involved in rRNA processing
MPTAETSYAPPWKAEDREAAIPAITRTSSCASVRTVEQFVAVIGPAAVGKSTITATLADRFGARVFRLREFADKYRERPTID